MTAQPDRAPAESPDADADQVLLDKRRALREQLLRRKRQQAGGRGRIPPAPRTGPLPLSRQQEGLWFLHELAPDSATYHLPLALRLRGELDLPALRTAVTALVERHEGLRTRFDGSGSAPRQVIDPPPADFPLPLVELAAEDWQQAVRDELLRPFELSTSGPFRAWVGRIAPDDHVLLLTTHHIVTDGWSAGIMLRELAELYSHGTLASPAPVVQPADFACWQRQPAAEAEQARGLDHWTSALAGLPELELPTDRPRPTVPDGSGAECSGALPAALGEQVVELARDLQAPLLAVLLAGFFVVLQRYSGQDDLAVGTVLSGRSRPELEPLVGYFANTVVVRGQLGGDPEFGELVRRCQDTVLGAMQHQDVPFGTVVDALRPQRIPGRNPLFQTSFSLLPAGLLDPAAFDGLAVEDVPVRLGRSRFDLSVHARQARDNRFELDVEYSTELFDAARIERLLAHLHTVLADAVRHPERRISELDVLPAAEREQVLHTFNQAAARLALPWDAPAPQLIAERAAVAGSRCAVLFEQAGLSYAELDERSRAVAGRLLRGGVRPGAVVGICARRSLELVAAILGIQRAGAAYLPLDPDLPAARLAFQLSDAGATVVLRQPGVDRDFADGVEVIDLGAAYSAEPAEPAELPTVRLTDPAYVLFTSGSTGLPKGVVVPHAGLTNRLAWMQAAYPLTSEDAVVQKTAFTFDVSVWEFLGPLAAGARLVLPRPDGHRDFPYLARLMHDHRVSVAHFVPTVLRSFLREPAARELTGLRQLFCGGEALTEELRDAVLSAWPRTRLDNLYGPTEASIDVTAWPCGPDDGSPIPIGRPISNISAYILDRQGTPAPIGVTGELHLAGVGLASHYANRAALTAERFVPCPFGPAGARMYRTGDLARWRADGAIEYRGRNDDQLKIRGLRMEPGEIEHALTEHPDVVAAAVLATTPPDADMPLLAAYLTIRPGRAVDDAELRAHLADRLPLHMIPAAFVTLAELPLTSSGKLDRKRLPAIDRQGTADGPLSQSELGLAEVWAEVLEVPVEQVRAGDNFFTLGGSSLDLARLAGAINKRFSLGLQVRDLYLAPSLRAAAGLIDGALVDGELVDGELVDGELVDRALPHPASRGAAPPRGRCLIPLRSTGNRPPLLLVHAVGGTAVPYLPLVQLLDEQQPVWAFEAPGIAGDAQPDSVAELAAAYVAAARELQPTGPYRLAGWSVGGVVAHQMARLLRDAGEQVALLAVFDSAPVTEADSAAVPEDTDALRRFADDLAGVAGQPPLALESAELRAQPSEARLPAVLDRLSAAGLIRDEQRDELSSRFDVFAAMSRALFGHRPEPYDGPIDVLAAAANDADLAAIWRPLAAEVRLHPVPGNHYTMLQPPNLGACAAVLDRLLTASHD